MSNYCEACVNWTPQPPDPNFGRCGKHPITPYWQHTCSDWTPRIIAPPVVAPQTVKAIVGRSQAYVCGACGREIDPGHPLCTKCGAMWAI